MQGQKRGRPIWSILPRCENSWGRQYVKPNKPHACDYRNHSTLFKNLTRGLCEFPLYKSLLSLEPSRSLYVSNFAPNNMLCLTNFILLFRYTSQLLKNQGSVWYSKSCSEFQKRKQIQKPSENSIYWMNGPSKPSDSSAHSNCPNSKHWQTPLKADAFPLGGAASLMVPGSAITLPSCPVSGLCFLSRLTCYLALSSGFVSRIYPRLNLSIFSELAWTQPQLLLSWLPGAVKLQAAKSFHCPACGYLPLPYALLCLNSFLHPLFISLHWEFRLWALV